MDNKKKVLLFDYYLNKIYLSVYDHPRCLLSAESDRSVTQYGSKGWDVKIDFPDELQVFGIFAFASFSLAQAFVARVSREKLRGLIICSDPIKLIILPGFKLSLLLSYRNKYNNDQ